MRPKSTKKICCCPVAKLFKPTGCGKEVSSFVELSREEVEALDLKDVKKYDQIKAAEAMNTSQSTFQRILASAHAKVGDALINGKIIKIAEDSSNCCDK